VQERNPDILSFSLKKFQQANPLQVPQGGPYGERYLLTVRVPGKGAPSMFPNRVPMDRDTPSPEPLVCLFISSFIYVCQSTQKGALLHMGKNIRSPSMEPHAEGRPTYSGVWPGLPRGMNTDCTYDVYYV
jgi:hypothetical protein